MTELGVKREGRIKEIADYCESDVVNTYRVWLRYELFRGHLTEPEYQASEACLGEFINTRGNMKLYARQHEAVFGKCGNTVNV